MPNHALNHASPPRSRAVLGMMMLIVLGATFAAPQANAAPMGMRRGPPDTFTHAPTLCALPKGGFCETGPMVRICERCFCDGPKGRRYGEVRQK